jgi:putative ABC transport system permease protein
MPLIALDYWDLALAALLLLVNAGLSIWLQLGLARDTLIAAGRMAVQLGLMGLVLKMLFGMVSPWLTGLFALAMAWPAGGGMASARRRCWRPPRSSRSSRSPPRSAPTPGTTRAMRSRCWA